ncbi:hypothetical protein VTN96DRAFT_4271 [Rasamsonia emersonii]
MNAGIKYSIAAVMLILVLELCPAWMLLGLALQSHFTGKLIAKTAPTPPSTTFCQSWEHCVAHRSVILEAELDFL